MMDTVSPPFRTPCAIFYYKIAIKPLPKSKKNFIIELYSSRGPKSRIFGKASKFYQQQEGARGIPPHDDGFEYSEKQTAVYGDVC